MKLIVGIGNPGIKYHNTKHNFGFWIIDKLVKERSLKYKAGKGDYIYASGNECMFVKPTTFVNDSGIAIKQILNYYDSLDVNDLIVIYDDIDINLGNIRFKAHGSDAGHNGVKSIIYHLNTDSFDRLKIGIATSMKMSPLEEYVLKPFSKKYKETINEVIDCAENGINFYLNHGIKNTMNNYNKKDNNNNGK